MEEAYVHQPAMETNFEEILKIFSLYIVSIQVAFLISLLYCLTPNRSYIKKHYLILTILFVVTIMESYGEYLRIQNIRNTIYFNIGFILLETILILGYYFWISDKTRLRQLIIISSVVFIGWFIINALFFQPIFTHFQTNSYLLGSLLIILFSGHFFYEIFTFQKYPNQNLLAVPHFWIVTGAFFFYTASLMFFISLQIPDIDRDFLIAIYPIVQTLSALMYLLMALSFYAPKIFKEKMDLELK